MANFNGGKKGMKRRIFTIMNMSKKKIGISLICCALMVTLGTGFVFAAIADNTRQETGIVMDTNQTATTNKPLKEYEKHGISYDADGNMLFEGKLVRYFWDGYEITSGMGATYYECLNDKGIIDVHTIYNKDGKLTGLAVEQ